MASGPITLLVDPPKGLYYDDAGVHTLPWHGPQFIGKPVGMVGDQTPHAVAFTMRIASYPETIVNRHGMFGSGTPLNDWTATNGTKSSTSYAFVIGRFEPFDHFQSDIYGFTGQGFGGDSNGGSGSFTILKVVSTGGDVDITTPLNQDSGTLWTARALVASDALVDRRATFIVNGVEQGMNTTFYPAHMIPAGGLTVIHGAHDTGGQGTTGQAFGIRIKDTTNGEAFYLLQMGTNKVDETGGIGFWPVRGKSGGVYPLSMLQDVAAVGVTTAWDGAVGNSEAHTGEAFWWVEATTDHIPDDTNFVLIARHHEMVRPVDHYGEEIGILNIGRYQAIYDYDETPGMTFEMGISDEFSFNPLAPRVCVADVYNASTDTLKVEAPFSGLEFEHEIDYTGTNFITYGLTIEPDQITVNRNLESATTPWNNPPWQGWMALDVSVPGDPVRFAPGHGRDHFHPSIGAYKEMAIASRPLSDGEWAFLADPDGIWSMNMFAYPELATVDGLDSPLYRGDDRGVIVTIMDENGDPVPLYGLTVWMTFKDQSDNDNDDDAAIEKFSAEISPAGAITAGTGFTIVDAIAGTLSAKFTVPTPSIRYDVQVANLDGDIRTLTTGTFSMAQDVTKRETLP